MRKSHVVILNLSSPCRRICASLIREFKMGSTRTVTGTPTTITITAAAVSTTTNLGPLTTVFTPPDSCTTLIYAESDANLTDAFPQTSFDRFVYAATCGTVFANAYGVGPDCVPSKYGEAYNKIVESSSLETVMWPVYSPGLHCPAGYYSACAFSKPLRSATPGSQTTDTFSSMMYSLVQPGEVAFACCPRSVNLST